MRVNLKYFAVCREITGMDGEQIELPEGATTADVWQYVLQHYPQLELHRSHSRLALNMRYLLEDAALKADDEVSIIPPVSGG